MTLAKGLPYWVHGHKTPMSEIEQIFTNMLQMISAQVAEMQIRFEALRLILEEHDETVREKYERKVQALRVVRGLQQAHNESDFLKQLEAEYKRLMTESAKGKPQ